MLLQLANGLLLRGFNACPLIRTSTWRRGDGSFGSLCTRRATLRVTLRTSGLPSRVRRLALRAARIRHSASTCHVDGKTTPEKVSQPRKRAINGCC